MKTLLRSIGIIALLFAALLFVYGSIKMKRSADAGKETIDIGGGITATVASKQEKAGNSAFTFALVAGIFGIGLLVASRGRTEKQS